MGANVRVMPTQTVLPTVSPEAQLRSTSPTERAAEPMTLDVPPQAQHLRGEGSQMDVQSMTEAGVTIAGTEEEDPAEYFDGHDDVGELLDPLVDEAEADETTKAKQKELDRLAEFVVFEVVYIPVALGKKRVTTRWGCTTERRNQSAIRRQRVQER